MICKIELFSPRQKMKVSNLIEIANDKIASLAHYFELSLLATS